MKSGKRGAQQKVLSARFLRSKAIKELRRESVERLGVQLFSKKRVQEIILSDGTAIYIVNEKVRAFRKVGMLYPTLKAFIDGAVRLPKVIVDMGAVPHVAKGADIMAPGIVEMDRDAEKGGLVVVTEERYDRPIAIGVVLMGPEEVDHKEKGRAIQNLHYIGDKIWTVGGRP